MSMASQIPQTPREPYTGPDMFTNLPDELLIKIFGFLHAPGERKWSNKAALKAINSIRYNKLCTAVKEELFKYVTLSFSYQGHVVNGVWFWETPNLIQILENHAEIRGLVKAVRVRIKPVPDRKGKDKLSRYDIPNLGRHDCSLFVSNWENAPNFGASFAAVSPTYSFVDEPGTTMTLG